MGTGVQEVCGICILENAPSSPGQGPEQPALAGLVLNRVFPNGLQAPLSVYFVLQFLPLCARCIARTCCVLNVKEVSGFDKVLCGKEGSTNSLFHCTELLFRPLLEIGDIKLQHVIQYE